VTGSVAGRRGGRPLVLMYHGVGTRSPATDPYNLFVPAPALEAQLRALLDRGRRPLPLADYLAGRGDGRHFLVTFDDGYRSVHGEAMPVLGRLGVPATVFVLAGRFGGVSAWMPEMPGEPLLTAAEIVALQAGGIDIGLHGLDHAALPGLPPERLREQVHTAADLLAEVTGGRPRAFAYPYGRHDAAARAAVAAAGFEVAFSTHLGCGGLAVPRVDVNATDSRATFLAKTSAAYPRLRRLAGTLPGLRPAVRALLGGGRSGG
jgi:peptidoglycan/xylan/chitin deacetylase (PgdA/CDA1 family)